MPFLQGVNMKHLSTTQLALTFFMTGLGQHVVAQSSPELEITMQVIEAGQRPAGLIQRIELPPPDFFLQEEIEFSNTELLQEAVQVEANDLQETVNDIVADSVRDTISINGIDAGNLATPEISIPDIDLPDTGTPDLEAPIPETLVDTLPGDIVDILDEDLPLQNTLEETLTDVTGQAPELVDGIISSSLTLPDSDTSLTEQLDVTVDNPAMDIVDVVGDANAELELEDVQSLNNELSDSATSLLETVEQDVVEASQDVSEETSDAVSDLINSALPNN
jgi:hypothetical protein